jgi:hypothetical protein
MSRAVRGNPKGIVAWGTPLGLANYGLGRRDRAEAIWERSRRLVAEVLAVNPDLMVEAPVEALGLDRMQPALAASMHVALRGRGMPMAVEGPR